MRRAGTDDADYVTDLLARAFQADPTWSWAFPDPAVRLEHHRRWWGLFVTSALPHGEVWLSDDGGAAAVWVPPGRPELSEAAEAAVEPLLRELVGAHADDVLVLLERFDAHHPHDQPHHYLSLLGTHPDHRGRGQGMALLAECLRRTDETGLPAYLESSNRANDHRYARRGFRQIGEFSAPDGGPSLACMWREPGGA